MNRDRAWRAGTRVRLRPSQRADIVDLALTGRTALVDRIEVGNDGRIHVVVVLDDDPARVLGPMSQIGHRFFFTPEELERLDEPGDTGPRTLIAGLGDGFNPADVFGSTVVQRLRTAELPGRVDVYDFGIRTGDLVHAARGYDAALVACTRRLGHQPATVRLVDCEELPHVHHVVAYEPGTGAVPETAIGEAVRLIEELTAELAESATPSER